jgi:hypothetical protein
MLWLDFDGVLANSVSECLFLVESISGKLTKRQKEKFIRNRYLVNEPYGFFVLSDLCKSNLKQFDFEFTYNDQYHKFESHEIELLHQDFFEKRKILMEQDLSQWCEINSPTQFFTRLKLLKIEPTKINIISTKNYDALKAWLDFYNFEVAKIFGNREFRLSKNKFNIIKREAKNNSIFIDDNYVHIDGYDWNSINCKALFASWGYNKDSADNTNSVIKVIKNDLCN